MPVEGASHYPSVASCFLLSRRRWLEAGLFLSFGSRIFVAGGGTRSAFPEQDFEEDECCRLYFHWSLWWQRANIGLLSLLAMIVVVRGKNQKHLQIGRAHV